MQTWSTSVKAPTISYRGIVSVEALSANEKAIVNLSERIGFDGSLEGSSVNHENDYHKLLKIISKSKLTFTDVDNKNDIALVSKCSSKYKCALCVNLKPSDKFET